MSKVTIPRTAPYLAAGAPTTPRMLALAGALVALAALVASWWDVELPTDPDTVALVGGLLASAWGLWQDRRARREQATGAQALAGVPELTAADLQALLERGRDALAAAGRSGPAVKRRLPTMPPEAPAPRTHAPSGALLGDDGEPVSAGDLEDDPDPDDRTTERVDRDDAEREP